MSRGTFSDTAMWQRIGHSLSLSLITALVLTLLAVILVYTLRLHAARFLNAAGRLSMIGYAAPGAVVAVGVMVCFATLDRWLQFAGIPLHVGGTVFAIGFAYMVRFFAVPAQPVKAAMTRVCGSLDEASRLLGHPPARTLLRINLPLIKGTVFSATMLVFVDILKELPLTMILRPDNFETLATLAFGLAKEGRIQECAVPSLVIILLAAIGLMGLNRFIRSSTT